jgi:hypothetical protein
MKHSAMLKFTVFVVVVAALLLGGCVNVTDPIVSTVDLRSTVRFVNFANVPGAATMSVAIDNSTSATASVAFQSSSSYIDLPAGARFWRFSYGATQDTLRRALTPNYQYTYYSVYEPQNGDVARTYVLATERNTYAGTATFAPGTQVVRFLNLSSDTAATVSGGLTFHLMFGTTDTSATVSFGSATPYYQAALSSSPEYMVVGAAGDTLAGPTAVNAAAGRYSIVFVGSQAASSWTTKVLPEN